MGTMAAAILRRSAQDHPDRRAVEIRQDVFDALRVEPLHRIGDHVAEMRIFGRCIFDPGEFSCSGQCACNAPNTSSVVRVRPMRGKVNLSVLACASAEVLAMASETNTCA
jgi:hypothetical protein